MNVEYIYFSRGKCPDCDDVLWTTDDVCGVSCKCMKTTIEPDDIGRALEITDEEHNVLIREEIQLKESDNLVLIKG